MMSTEEEKNKISYSYNTIIDSVQSQQFTELARAFGRFADMNVVSLFELKMMVTSADVGNILCQHYFSITLIFIL